MSRSSVRLHARRAAGVWLVPFALALTLGCKGTPVESETAARDSLARAAIARDAAMAAAHAATAPPLTAGAPFESFARYAVVKSPAVAERFAAWSAEVETITLVRSFEDPTLSFESEIDRVLAGLAIGIAGAVPWPGKRALAADAQAALADARRAEFEAEVASAIGNVRGAYVETAFNEESIAIAREVLALVDELVEITKTRLRVAQVNQLDLLRIEIERDQLANEIAGLEDNRTVLRARLKSALGIAPRDADPPTPVALPERGTELPAGDLLTLLLERNPRLHALEAEIRSAESLVALARKSAYPDFMFGVRAGVFDPMGATLGSPVTLSPEVGITLPIFRDKIDANIAAALAQQQAAEARLEGERLRFVVDLANGLFLYRDALRRLNLFGERLLPKGRDAVDVARTGYGSGAVDLTALLDAERSLRAFRLGAARARLDREIACAQIEYEMLARVPADLQFTAAEQGSEP